MPFIKSVFDRTSEDVLKVQSYDMIGFNDLTEEQKNEWLSGLKGALNRKDLNRIESNCKFLADLYGGISGMIFKTNWRKIDIITLAEIQRIVKNIAKLRSVFKVLENTPKTPEIPINTHLKINDLEQILNDIYYVFENENLAFTRSDSAYGAELYTGDLIGDI